MFHRNPQQKQKGGGRRISQGLGKIFERY